MFFFNSICLFYFLVFLLELVCLFFLGGNFVELLAVVVVVVVGVGVGVGAVAVAVAVGGGGGCWWWCWCWCCCCCCCCFFLLLFLDVIFPFKWLSIFWNCFLNYHFEFF